MHRDIFQPRQTFYVRKSLLTRIKIALENKDYALASSLQIEMQQKIQELTNLYLEYRSNIL